MRTRLLSLLLLTSLLLSACQTSQPPAELASPSLTAAADQAAEPDSASRLALPDTSTTPLQPNATPTQLPPTQAPTLAASSTPSTTPEPTPSPMPALPRGTLTLSRSLGLGNGLRFSGYALQLTPDEQRLIVTTAGGIHILSAEDLSLLRSISAPADYDNFDPYGGVYRRRIRVAADGSLAAMLALQEDYQKTVQLWDLTSGEQLRACPLPPGDDGYAMDVADLALSPDNTRLVVVSEEGLILVLDTASCEILETIERYMNNLEQVRWLEYEPSGENVYLTYQDVGISGIHTYGLDSQTWEETSQALENLSNFGSEVAAFAPKPSTTGYTWGFFARSGASRINAWDYTNFGKRFSIDLPAGLSAMTFTPDSQWLVVGSINPPRLEVWPAESTQGPRSTFEVERPLWAVAGTSGGKTLYGISEDGNLYLWHSDLPQPVHTLAGFYPTPGALAYTADDLALQFTLRNQQEIFSLSPEDGSILGFSPNPEFPAANPDQTPISADISPDQLTLAVLYWDEAQFELYDQSSGKLLRKVPAEFTLDEIAFTPDGLGMFVIGYDHPLQVLDIRDGTVLAEIDTLESLGNRIYGMRLSGDRSTLVLFGETGVIEVYDASTLELLQAIDAIEIDPFQAALSNDGSLLAFVQIDGQLGLLDLRTGTKLYLVPLEISDYALYETRLAFSLDGRELAVAFPSGQVSLYSIAP
jgi:WD40 repeat protein